MKFFLPLSLLLLSLAACGPGSDTGLGKDGVYNPTGLPQYCFKGTNENGKLCSTGVLRFKDHSELCAGLQNENLNSRCAFGTETERRRYFATNCDGSFTRDYTPVDLQPYEECSEIVVRKTSIRKDI